jgi:uncharacterized protein (DUF58 family)
VQKQKQKKNGIILKIIICVLIVTGTAIPAVFMNSIYGYLPVLTVIIAIGLSYCYLILLKRSLTFEEMSNLQNCRRGADVDFTVNMRNKSFLVYPGLEVFFYISDIMNEHDTVTSQVITLASREERKFDFTVRFDHIGTYSAGLKRMVVHDLLGLFSYSITNLREYKVNVAPKIFDIDRVRVSSTVLTDSEKMIVPTQNDGADYTGVREYVWGDPIKTIHWKLSARSDNYLTKQFENYGVVGMTIILDYFSPKYDNETLMSVFDAIVETGLSIGNFAEENGMDYEIIYTDKNGEHKKFNTGRHSDFVDVIGEMQRISYTEGANKGAELLLSEGNARYAHGNIVYCTADINSEITEIMVALKSNGKNPILCVVVPKSLEGDERDKYLRPVRALGGAGIACYIISSAEELGKGELL